MIRTLHIKIDPKSIKVDKRLDIIGHELSRNPVQKPQFGQWIDVKDKKEKKVSTKGPWHFVIDSFNFSIDLGPQPGEKLQGDDIGKVISHIDFAYKRHDGGGEPDFTAKVYRLDREVYIGYWVVRAPGLDGIVFEPEWVTRTSDDHLRRTKYQYTGLLLSPDQVEVMKKLMTTAVSLVKQAIQRSQSQAHLKSSQVLDEKLFFVFDTSGGVDSTPVTAQGLGLARWLKEVSRRAGADISKIRERVKDDQEIIFTGVKDREIQELIIICHATALCALERNAKDHFSGKIRVKKPIIVNLSNKKNSTNLADATATRARGMPKGFDEASLPVIRINYPLFKYDLEARKELLATYLHEFSHLIVGEAYGQGMVKAHGREFKEVMVVMGERPMTHGVATAAEMQAARKRYQEAVGRKGSDFEPATVEYMEEIARSRPKRKLPPKKVEPEIKEVSEETEVEEQNDDMDFSQFDEG